MNLKLQNIEIIKQANISLDGLTVIAGGHPFSRSCQYSINFYLIFCLVK